MFNFCAGGRGRGSLGEQAKCCVNKAVCGMCDLVYGFLTRWGSCCVNLTAGTGKKISLELGGKSPVIVFESADLDTTLQGVVDAIWRWWG